MFELLNSLRIFDCITFIQSTHKYLINEQPSANVSVTGLLSLYKEKFDQDKWSNITAKKRDLPVDVILSEWKQNNLYATHRGTIVHNFIENYYNNKIIQYDKKTVEADLSDTEHNRLREEVKKLIEQFKSFYRDTPDIYPLKKEFVVGDIHDTKICGMIDMVAYNTKTNTFEIYDYKTNKEINFKSRFNKVLLDPLTHIEDCEFNTYSLQLNIYKYFIEKYTPVKIDALKLVWFNVKNDNYQVIPLLDLQSEVRAILTDYTRKNNI